MYRSRVPSHAAKRLKKWQNFGLGCHPKKAQATRLAIPGWAAAGAMIHWPALAAHLHLQVPPKRLLWALAFTVAFALSARWLKAVTLSGALAGGVLAFLLFLGGGPGTFAVLITVFLLTWASTRIGHSRKQQLGTAERQGGRSASQVVANVGIAAVAALASLITGHPGAWLVAAAAGLAEAAADTTSSEVGEALGHTTYLITNFRAVPAGTDGGISVPGSLAGILAALSVATVAWALRMIAPNCWLPVGAAGLLGMFVDSLLGASLERRRLLNNDAVNLLSTLSAAVFALFLYWS